MKGRLALLMKEEARKKTTFIAEQNRISLEQHLSRERERILEGKWQAEMNGNADCGDETSQPYMDVEIDTKNGWETESEGGLLQSQSLPWIIGKHANSKQYNKVGM